MKCNPAVCLNRSCHCLPLLPCWRSKVHHCEIKCIGRKSIISHPLTMLLYKYDQLFIDLKFFSCWDGWKMFFWFKMNFKKNPCFSNCHEPSQPLSQLYPTPGQPCPDIANPGDTLPQWTFTLVFPSPWYLIPPSLPFVILLLCYPLFHHLPHSSLYSLSFPMLPCTLILGI